MMQWTLARDTLFSLRYLIISVARTSSLPCENDSLVCPQVSVRGWLCYAICKLMYQPSSSVRKSRTIALQPVFLELYLHSSGASCTYTLSILILITLNF
jgi:hypothetical protein